MTYTEQIKHPKWQKKRLEILERDEFTCRSCGDDEETLNIHHCYYEKDKMIWEYPNENLLTLCDVCHTEWHMYKKKIDKLLIFPTDWIHEIYNIIECIDKTTPVEIAKIVDLIKRIYLI